MSPVSSLARQIAVRLLIAEHGPTAASSETNVWAVATLIDAELIPVRAAIKDLALAAAFCAEHRDRRTEVVQPFMGFEEHTVIHDLGPTEDAARCQAAIDKARPVLEAFKLHLNQPPPIAPHSTIIR